LLYRTYTTSTTVPPHIYTLSLHDALPISSHSLRKCSTNSARNRTMPPFRREGGDPLRDRAGGSPSRPGKIPCDRHPSRSGHPRIDRKSTRLNSSHVEISYAVFCLKKKIKC